MREYNFREGIMINCITKFFTKFCHNKVGVDQFGNEYYVSKSTNAYNKYIRTVIYKGMAEPTKIPPMWHGWMHYTTDEIPREDDRYSWQKDHHPNRTGTSQAYLPDGHPLSQKVRTEPSRGDYVPWSPNILYRK